MCNKTLGILLFLIFTVMPSVSPLYGKTDDGTVVCHAPSDTDTIQEPFPTPADTLTINVFRLYYVCDESTVREDYMDNAAQMDSIRNYLATSPRIDSIAIYAYSSPEGPFRRNSQLSILRAETARDFILANGREGLADAVISLHPMDENWDGLREEVVKSYHRHDRNKVLRFIDDKSVGVETRKWRLQQLDKGYTWSLLKRKYMPQLRYATWICVWEKPELPLISDLGGADFSYRLEQPDKGINPERRITPVGNIRKLIRQSQAQSTTKPERQAQAVSNIDSISQPQAAPDSVKIIKPQFTDFSQRYANFALRTNLLMPATNIGAEYAINNNWTVDANYYFPWFWPQKKNKDCFELLGWSVGGRYYFGKQRTVYDHFKGHSLGLYFIGGYFDFERNYNGTQGQFIGPGMEYKYSMPVGRKKRVNLDFAIAVGYIYSWGTPYTVPYENGPLYPEDYSVRYHYFGPTRIAVGLTVPLYKKEVRR